LTADVVVIGGGIAGASTAYHLSRLGHDVALVERGEIASGASGVNAGAIDSIGWGHAPDLQAHLTAGSLEIFKTIQLDLGYDVEFRQSGALQAIHTEEQLAFTHERVARLCAAGHCVELLTIRDARAIEPALSPALLGAMYSPLRSQANPVKATRAFATAAEASGARVLTGHEVTGLSQRGGGTYVIDTSRGQLTARALVLAAGAWCGPIGRMLGLHIPIVPVRGQMWAAGPVPPAVFQTISSAESAMQWTRSPGNDRDTPPQLTHRGDTRLTRHLYGRQTREGEIIFGGDRQLVGYDTTPEGAGIEVNHAHAADVLPLLRSLPIRRTWAGLMPFSLDGRPIIGRIPGRENCYVVTGLASSGFGRGPMAGKLLADFIHGGHRPDVLAAADPARCVTLSEGH